MKERKGSFIPRPSCHPVQDAGTPYKMQGAGTGHVPSQGRSLGIQRGTLALYCR